jgi:hypothetical protein
MYICYFSGKNLLKITDLPPDLLVTHDYNSMMCCSLTFAIHIYHTIFFKLNNTELYHHIIYVFLTAIFLTSIYPHIYLSISITTFFITGLPGGIVYFLLCLQKRNLITKITQKQIHSYIDTYIRIPGGILSSILNFNTASLCQNLYVKYVYYFLFVLAYSNVTYYGKMAIENNIEYQQKQKN